MYSYSYIISRLTSSLFSCRNYWRELLNTATLPPPPSMGMCAICTRPWNVSYDGIHRNARVTFRCSCRVSTMNAFRSFLRKNLVMSTAYLMTAKTCTLGLISLKISFGTLSRCFPQLWQNMLGMLGIHYLFPMECVSITIIIINPTASQFHDSCTLLMGGVGHWNGWGGALKWVGWVHSSYWWLSARLRYLHCSGNGDTSLTLRHQFITLMAWLVQGCNILIASTSKMPQFCTKTSVYHIDGLISARLQYIDC